jgi:lysophospholipase L1-like esterase
LCPELTDDGGHLNARGKIVAAAALLNVLDALCNERSCE